MWRVRQVLSVLTAYFLWTAIFSTQQKGLFGYSESMMMTYVFVAAFVQAIVLSVRSIDLAGVINSGNLSNILIKPISNFWYWFSEDIADKLLNVFFSLGELVLLFFILKPTFAFPSLLFAVLFLPSLLLAAFLYYLINYLFGLLGFWTPDVWAPRFLLFVFLQSLAGVIFPLDVFPQWLQQLAAWTPFPTLVYIPTQVFLSRLSIPDITKSFIVGGFWTIIFLGAVQVVWRKGLRRYSSEGR